MAYEVDWDAQHYYVQTGPFSEGGELYVASSPCDLISALQGSQGVTESSRGLIDRISADCQTWRQTNPAPAPGPVAPAAPTPGAPPTTPAPTSTDSPAQQGAAAVASSASVNAHGTAGNVGTVSSAAPSHAAFDQFSPIPPDVLASWLAPDADAAGRADLEQRIARNQPMPGQRDPTFGAPATRAPAHDADPVDLSTGTFTLAVTDLEVPTPDEPIRFERSYRSGRPFFGPFGFAWDHSHHVYLRPLADGSLAWWTGRLLEYVFTPAAGPGPGWDPPVELAARIERLPGPDEQYAITRPGGEVLRFARPPGWSDVEKVPLAAVSDRHGNEVAYGYDDHDRVTSVLDDAGRGLLLSYGQCGLLEHVSDHTGTRRVDYDHDERVEHLVCVRQPPTARYPDGPTAGYDYDDTADHPAMRHNIVRLRDAQDDTYVETSYAGPEAGWAFNTVTRQLVAGQEYRFELLQLQYVPALEDFLDLPASRTVVEPPDGSLHTYTFNYRGDLLDHRFRLNADGSFRVVATRFAYDRVGNLTEVVEPDGLRRMYRYAHDDPDPCARRNLLRTEVGAPVAAAVPSRVLTTIGYDDAYQLPVRVVDEGGSTTRLRYDTDLGEPGATGRLRRVELPEVTLADGTRQDAVTRVEDDLRGRCSAVTSPGQTRLELRRTAGGLLDGFVSGLVRDATGCAEATGLGYDATGFPASVTPPGLGPTLLRHNALGQLEEQTPPAVDGAVPTPTRVWFGDDGQPVRIDRPRGSAGAAGPPTVTELVERDVLGRVRTLRLGAGLTGPEGERERVRSTYVDHAGRVVREVDPAGAETRRRYDERGLLLSVTTAPGTPDELVERRSYDLAGRLVRLVDPAGWATTWTYDVWGRVREVGRPTGARQVLHWAADDRLTAVEVLGPSEPAAAETLLSARTFTYDERGRLVSDTLLAFVADDPQPAVPLSTRFAYDADDRLCSVELPTGGVLRQVPDGLGRPTRIEFPSGAVLERGYGPNGQVAETQLTETTGGVPRTIRWTAAYDARGRVASWQTPLGAIASDHDDADRLVEQREPGGVTVRFGWNAFGEPERTEVDPGGLAIVSRWQHDDAGRVRAFVDPTAALTRWGYDQAGRIASTDLPDGSRRSWAYGDGGRSVRRTTPTGQVSVDLDAFGSPTTLECTPAPGFEPVPPHVFGYDGLGRLVSARIGAEEMRRRWDSLGRWRGETALGGDVDLTYDDLAHTFDLTYPDGRRERTGTDHAGRPTTTELVAAGTLGGTPGSVLVAVQHEGRPVRLTHGNGVVTDLAYDVLNRVVGLRHTGPTGGGPADVVDHRGWRDERHRLAVRSDLPGAGGGAATARVDVFDRGDRLVTETRGLPVPGLPGSTTVADQLSAADQARTTALTVGEPETRLPDDADALTAVVRGRTAPVTDARSLAPDHRVLGSAAGAVDYHPGGHRRRDPQHDYDVDGLGRVVAVRDRSDGSVVASFDYDALSRAARGSVAGVAYARSYLGGTWVQESRGGLAGLRQMTPHPVWPQPLCVTTAEGTSYAHPDLGLSLGSLTGPDGTLRARYGYGVDGEPAVLAPDGVTPLVDPTLDALIEPSWHGLPRLGGTGLLVSGQRLYDSGLGVFVAPDPLLYRDSPDPYAYAGGDPVDFVDLTGLAKAPLSETPRRRPTEEELREKVPLLPFFLPVPAPYVRPYQAPPVGAPTGLDAIRRLNGQPSVAVASFSRDQAPGTSVQNLTMLSVQGIAGAVGIAAAASRVGQAAPAVRLVTPGLRAVEVTEVAAPGSGAGGATAVVRAAEDSAGLAGRGQQLFNEIGAEMFKNPTDESVGMLKKMMTLSLVEPQGGGGMRIVTTQNARAYNLMARGTVRLLPNEVLGPPPLTLVEGEAFLAPPGKVHAEVLGVWNARALGFEGGLVYTTNPACGASCAPLFRGLPMWVHLNLP